MTDRCCLGDQAKDRRWRWNRAVRGGQMKEGERGQAFKVGVPLDPGDPKRPFWRPAGHLEAECCNAHPGWVTV